MQLLGVFLTYLIPHFSIQCGCKMPYYLQHNKRHGTLTVCLLMHTSNMGLPENTPKMQVSKGLTTHQNPCDLKTTNKALNLGKAKRKPPLKLLTE